MGGLGGRLKSLFSDGIIRHARTLLAGTLLAQIINVCITPVLFRLYGKAEIDALGAFTAIFFLLVGAAALRLEQAVLIAKDRAQAMVVLRLAGVAAFTVSLILFLVLLVFGGPISAALKLPILAQHPWTLPLALFGGSLYLVLTAWFTREKLFKITARTTVTQAIAMAITQIGGGVFLKAYGAVILVVGLAIGRSAGVFSFLKGLNDYPESKSKWDWREMGEALKRYREFAVFNSPAFIANAAGTQLPAILLQAQFPEGSSASYYGAMRILGLPISLLGLAIGQAYQGHMAQSLREGPDKALALFDSTVKRLMVLGLAIIPVMATAPLWDKLVLGHNAGNAGLWIAILSPCYAIALACNPISTTATMTESHGRQLALDIIRLVLTGASFVAPAALGWNATWAVIIYSAMSTVLYGVYLYTYRNCIKLAASKAADVASPTPEPAT